MVDDDDVTDGRDVDDERMMAPLVTVRKGDRLYHVRRSSRPVCHDRAGYMCLQSIVFQL